jgi:nitrate reductase NapE component
MPAQPEKKSRKWILFLVLGLIVICACLAIAAVGGYALFMGNGSVTF